MSEHLFTNLDNLGQHQENVDQLGKPPWKEQRPAFENAALYSQARSSHVRFTQSNNMTHAEYC